MGAGYLVDTNMLVYYFDGKLPEDVKPTVGDILRHSFRISVISQIEFLSWQGFTRSSQKKAKAFLHHADVLELSSEVVKRTIELRQKKRIKLADGIITATALTYDLTLVTRNTSDFSGIEDLTLLNPFEAHRV